LYNRWTLNITILDGEDEAWVSYKHEDEHVPYWKIDVPPDIQQFVETNAGRMTAKQVSGINPVVNALIIWQLWDVIIQQTPKPPFSQKAIYQLWYNHTSKQWRRDDDKLKSTRILIEEASKKDGPTRGYARVENIPLHTETGYSAIAFSLPEILRKWGGRIRELSLDSACEYIINFHSIYNILTSMSVNTNGSNYEVYAIVGEVYGSGCPVGYLLVRSPKDSITGAKERYLRDVLKHLRDTWKVRALATLTDKDWSEINACLKEYPEAKHQLCFWHCLDAIKKRLSILRRRPGYYNVEQAVREFEFIDKNFVPVGQSTELNPVRE
jgi:hypothetical protein